MELSHEMFEAAVNARLGEVKFSPYKGITGKLSIVFPFYI